MSHENKHTSDVSNHHNSEQQSIPDRWTYDVSFITRIGRSTIDDRQPELSSCEATWSPEPAAASKSRACIERDMHLSQALNFSTVIRLLPLCLALATVSFCGAFHHCMRPFRQVYRVLRPHSALGTTGRYSFREHLATSSSSRLYAANGSKSFASMTDGSPNYTPYERWVRRIYQTNLFNPVKLGLSNIAELHKAMGYPMDHRPVIHVAGTNGKGSVALKIATSLQLLNPSLKVGLFCSPHVSCFRERMQINGQLISEDKVVECLPPIYDLCEQNEIPATFFEITTALAFSYFQDADVVVLETGLGGRLDATNVIQAPALSIITSIGLEHTRILGDTIELIALEKGGIIKKDCPVLVGPHCPHDVLRECAIEKGASQYYTCDDILGKVKREITDYDEENARTARAALTTFKDKYPQLVGSFALDILDQGTSIRPPCRFETVAMDDDLTVVLDVAHNPPAMEYLIRKLQDTYPDSKIRIVVGMSSDKDMGLVGKMLLNFVNVDSIHLVEAFHPRAAKIEHIIEGEPRLKDSHWIDDDRTITTQIKTAMRIAREKDEILVVCGSVFLMAEAREALGFDEPRDSEYIAEVAGAHLRHGQEVFANTDPEVALNGSKP